MKKSRLWPRLWNNPPTIAAKLITCVGRCFVNNTRVAIKSVKSQFFELTKIHFSLGNDPLKESPEIKVLLSLTILNCIISIF